jgi:hypothetical protein
VEAAERLFTDARTRVHSENIGLCRLPDGTRLVRVGKALPGELAAWRYGRQLTRRRRRSLAMTTAGAIGAVGGGGILLGLPLLVSAGTPLVMANAGFQLYATWVIGYAPTRVVVRRPARPLAGPGADLIDRRVSDLRDSVYDHLPGVRADRSCPATVRSTSSGHEMEPAGTRVESTG